MKNTYIKPKNKGKKKLITDPMAGVPKAGMPIKKAKMKYKKKGKYI